MKNETLFRLREECEHELHNIAQWWIRHAVDHENGGFYGTIDGQAKADENANKGVILNTRILWFFSELAVYHTHPKYRDMADRAFHYIEHYFTDAEHGGLYWELNAQGKVVSDRKQIFAQAFGLYAYSAYYVLTKRDSVLTAAMRLFDVIEQHAKDQEHGGYFAAFSNNWQALDNMALDENDIDAPKTFDTELHIVEAYTALYRAFPAQKIADALRHNVSLFDRYLLDKQARRCRTHFTRDWQDVSLIQIYGHSYEGAWLYWEAVCALGAPEPIQQQWQTTLIDLIEYSLDNHLSERGSVHDSKKIKTGEINQQSTWWIQTEALIALQLAYKMSGKEKFLQALEHLWQWIKTAHIDETHAEWRGIAGESMKQDKVSMWKGPYHNGRAMLEMCRRLSG